MINIQPEQLRTISLGNAVGSLELFAGQKVGSTPPEAIPSNLETATTTQDILEIFYNGGALQAVRSILMGSYGRAKEDETGSYRTMQRTFQEPVPSRDNNGDASRHSRLQPDHRKRVYIAKYYPATHHVIGVSYFLDHMHNRTGLAYDLAIRPEDAVATCPPYETQEPAPTQLMVAGAAIQKFTFDVALDTAQGLSGA